MRLGVEEFLQLQSCGSFTTNQREPDCLHQLPRSFNVNSPSPPLRPHVQQLHTHSEGESRFMAMAVNLRPTILRQVRLPLQSCRSAASQPYPLTRLSAFHTYTSARPSLLPTDPRTRLSLRIGPTSQATRVAAFHASGRRPILPAEPRKYLPAGSEGQ